MLHELDGRAEEPRRGPRLLGAVGLHVDEVGADPVRIALVAGNQRLVGAGRGPVAVLGLTPHELPLPEAAGEVHPRDEVVGHVGEEAGMVAAAHQRLGDGRLVGRHGLPAGDVDVVPGHGGIAGEGEGPAARVQGASRRDGGQAFGMGVGEANALSSEAVQVGRVDPVVAVGTEIGGAQRIRHDDDDVAALAHRFVSSVT